MAVTGIVRWESDPATVFTVSALTLDELCSSPSCSIPEPLSTKLDPFQIFSPPIDRSKFAAKDRVRQCFGKGDWDVEHDLTTVEVHELALPPHQLDHCLNERHIARNIEFDDPKVVA